MNDQPTNAQIKVAKWLRTVANPDSRNRRLWKYLIKSQIFFVIFMFCNTTESVNEYGLFHLAIGFVCVMFLIAYIVTRKSSLWMRYVNYDVVTQDLENHDLRN